MEENFIAVKPTYETTIKPTQPIRQKPDIKQRTVEEKGLVHVVSTKKY